MKKVKIWHYLISIQRSKTTLSTRALLHLHWTVTEPDRKTTIKYEVGQYTQNQHRHPKIYRHKHDNNKWT